MERRLYKVSISVNFHKKMDLKEKINKINNDIQKFNEESGYKKVLRLITIENNIIYLLVIFNVNKGYEKFALRHVADFLKKICSLYNMQYSKEYFFIEENIALTEEDYRSISMKIVLNTGGDYKDVDKGSEDQTLYDNGDELEENSDNLDKAGNNLINNEEMRVPKRKFPDLSNGTTRIGVNEKKDDIEFKTLKDTLNYLDNLIGQNHIKQRIKQITSFITRNNDRYIRLNIDNPGLYYNVVISGNRGTGKNTIAKILYHLYYHLGVIGNGKFIIVDSREVWPGNNLDRLLGNAQSGVVFINNVHLISTNDKRGGKDNFDILDEWMSAYKSNFVFILAGEAEGISQFIQNEKVKKHIHFLLDIPDFTENEALELVKHFASIEKYKVDEGAYDTIVNYISYLKGKKLFENIYTSRRIVEQAIINNGIYNNLNALVKEDFLLEYINTLEKETKETEIIEPDPFEELQSLIGLSEVKEKVKEISAYVETQLRRKELGLKTEPLCLHMSYVGNPGTGKTTVARLIGRIFNKMGILSTGKFVEVSREDLVGKYVGHTAIKTAEKIKEAEGGILFIDEAYSLESHSKIDYGLEAVSTIVKKMEDLRGNLVIIFAGYPKEMGTFINMNPGLRDRVQFKLEFQDYKPMELLEIWEKFFIDNQYEVEEDALVEMDKIVNKIYINKDCNFSNGRIIRKCFERAKMHQAIRIKNNGLNSVEELVKINIDDIKSLYYDEDIAVILEDFTLKKKIGFAM
ncbi:MAG: AAA family ATPase [Clostridium lundense]|nr:AAA family ATPase [Clostridium lundense]